MLADSSLPQIVPAISLFIRLLINVLSISSESAIKEIESLSR